MLKFLLVIILFLSFVMINLFSNDARPYKYHASFHLHQKFDYYSDLDLLKDIQKGSRHPIGPHTKFLYLSFDDGPLNGSQNINKIAQKYQAPMNVMVVGQHVFMNANQKRYFKNYMQNPFIEVCNHSYSHAHNHYYTFYNNPQVVLSDFDKSSHLLGLNNKIIRLPGRNVWSINGKNHNHYHETKQAVKLLTQKGYKVIGWDIEWKYNRKTKKPINSYQEFFTKLQNYIDSSHQKPFTNNNIVVLLHDPMFRTDASELENLIKLIQKNGDYILVPLSQYPIVANRVNKKKSKA